MLTNLNDKSVKIAGKTYNICLPQAGEIWSKSDDPNYTKFWAFLQQKAVSHVNHSDIWLASFLKRFLQVKQFHDAKWFDTRLPSFVIPKINI